MSSTFTAYANRIWQAKNPEDLFGTPDSSVANLADYIHYQFREIGKYVHPDRNAFSPESHDVFIRLNAFKTAALEKIAHGIYGSPTPFLLFDTKIGKIAVTEKFSSWPVSRQYHATAPDGKAMLFSFAMTPKLNGFIERETAVYKTLHVPEIFKESFLNLSDSGKIQLEDGSQYNYNLFNFDANYITLEQLKLAFPEGLDPKDIAWIYNQLLDILGILSESKVVHGAILPSNILIGVEDLHKAHLINFNGASTNGSVIPFMDNRFPDYYPLEITSKQPPSIATDLFMLSKCMLSLLRKDDKTASQELFYSFFSSLITKQQAARLISPFVLREQFNNLLQRLWGQRKYHPLQLPK